jgi:hypothetical protein
VVLAAVAARRQLEEQARTLDGALALIKDLAASNATGTGQAASAGAAVTWVTVPDLGDILAAAVSEPAADAERDAASKRSRLAQLRPLIPVPGVDYPVPEYVDRFQALCESVVLCGELGMDQETEELAQFGADLVLAADLAKAPPWILDMGGDISWAIAVTVGDSQWYHRALDRYQAAGDALRAVGAPAEALRDHALALAGRCLELCESGVAPRQRLIDTARLGLAELAQYPSDPDVAQVRYGIARAAADRAELAALADPSFPGRDALGPDDLRISQTLGDLADRDAWWSAFGPFAPPLHAWCTGAQQADAFAAFGLLGAEEDLPSAGDGGRLAQIGSVVMAEGNCDEVGARARQWMRLAEQSAPGSGHYMIGDVLHRVRRAVPAAGMISLARFARRDPATIPDSVSFLFQLGREHASAAAFSHQADRMLAFFEGLDESEASETCGAILLGAALAALPAAQLGAYITLLATGSGHLGALVMAGQGTPITAWITEDEPLPSEDESEA